MQSWFVFIIRPPLVLLRLLFGALYSGGFGWLDRRIAMRHHASLRRDIEDGMPFLFRTYHGKVVRNEGIAFPPGFDYAILTLALPELVFRFVRGRGELNVVVAPAFARGDWHELALVLSALDANEHLERGSCETLWDVSLALEPRIDGVIRLFSPANFDSLKMRLHDDVYAQDEINRRVWENELSRKFNS